MGNTPSLEQKNNRNQPLSPFSNNMKQSAELDLLFSLPFFLPLMLVPLPLMEIWDEGGGKIGAFDHPRFVLAFFSLLSRGKGRQKGRGKGFGFYDAIRIFLNPCYFIYPVPVIVTGDGGSEWMEVWAFCWLWPVCSPLIVVVVGSGEG